ncbi:hypothetical protein WJX82_008977 [Trebouxia sp. C0006]
MGGVPWLIVRSLPRARTQFLDPKKRLDYGGLCAVPALLSRHGLFNKDLDHSNKQSCEADVLNELLLSLITAAYAL